MNDGRDGTSPARRPAPERARGTASLHGHAGPVPGHRGRHPYSAVTDTQLDDADTVPVREAAWVRHDRLGDIGRGTPAAPGRRTARPGTTCDFPGHRPRHCPERVIITIGQPRRDRIPFD
ncbi:hypothetical protein SALBM311S_08001 [Streptomyces alboniger]